MRESTLSAQARQVMVNATKEMFLRDIPVTPENYRVWYTYMEESRLDLNEHIEDLTRSKVLFTEDLNSEIFRLFFGKFFHSRKQDAWHSLGKISNTKKDQDSTDIEKQINRFVLALEKHSIDIDKIKSPRGLNEVINHLATLSKSTSVSKQTAGKPMPGFAEEVEYLRKRIDVLSKEAHTDQLTTVGNRRKFESQFQELYQQAKQLGYTFTVLLLDIDHFKKFNDKYGHAAGDGVLRFVGKTLKAGVKGKNMVSRYGGEEFVILLPATDRQNGTILANNLLEKISSKKLSVGINQKTLIGNITISAGVAQYHQGDTTESLFKRADECLYRAKQSGRNRSVTESELLASSKSIDTKYSSYEIEEVINLP